MIAQVNTEVMTTGLVTSQEDWENKWASMPKKMHCNPNTIQPSSNTNTVEARKYLGVTISDNLTWDRHIDNIVSEGNKTLGFIRRNVKDFSKPVKAAAYSTIVRPSVEYACLVWDPPKQPRPNKDNWCCKKRTARFANNKFTDCTSGCVTNMVKSLKWESLQDRRKQNRLCILLKYNAI